MADAYKYWRALASLSDKTEVQREVLPFSLNSNNTFSGIDRGSQKLILIFASVKRMSQDFLLHRKFALNIPSNISVQIGLCLRDTGNLPM